MIGLLRNPVVAGLLGVAVLAAILELAVSSGLVMELVVPRPSDAVLAFPPVQEEMDLIGNFLVTLGMTGITTRPASSTTVTPMGTLSSAALAWAAAIAFSAMVSVSSIMILKNAYLDV